jgi:hypothetical protein
MTLQASDSHERNGFANDSKFWRFPKPFLYILGFKILYFAVLLLCLHLFPAAFDRGQQQFIRTTWFSTPDPKDFDSDASTIGRSFTTWDAAHYLLLAEKGYSRGLPSCAFYPLWPAAIWAGSKIGLSFVVSGLLAANFFSLCGGLLFYCGVRRRFGEAAANWSLFFFFAFPGALFLQFLYSESLFFFLLMVLWTGLEHRNAPMIWMAGFALPLTRAVGLFSIIPIAWHVLLDLYKPLGRPKTIRQIALIVSPVFIPMIGWGIYLLLMRRWTGNAFEGLQAQRFWAAHSTINLVNIPKFCAEFFNATAWHEFRGSVLDRGLFVLLVYFLPLIWKMGFDLFLWTYILAILPAMSGMFVSFTRFEAVAFPLFIALGVFCGRKDRPLARICFVTGFCFLHAVLVWRFANYRWAG